MVRRSFCQATEIIRPIEESLLTRRGNRFNGARRKVNGTLAALLFVEMAVRKAEGSGTEYNDYRWSMEEEEEGGFISFVRCSFDEEGNYCGNCAKFRFQVFSY